MGRKRTKVYGVGVNDWTGSIENPTSGKIKEYILWCGLLRKFSKYDRNFKLKNREYKSYPDDWNFMTRFISDVSRIHGYEKVISSEWVLNYSLLNNDGHISKNNTCCIPMEIQNIFTKRTALRGDLPIGVSYHKLVGKYEATISINSKKFRVGFFDSIDEAFIAYKLKKEEAIKEYALKWADEISDEVYQCLMNYKVKITD